MEIGEGFKGLYPRLEKMILITKLPQHFATFWRQTVRITSKQNIKCIKQVTTA